jgi:hypothetical protein
MNAPTDYPLPNHAAYIWTNGEKIIMTFPGYKGTDDRRFNSVQLDPKDPNSLFIIWDVLRRRANSHADERKIGTKATPTQWNIDEVLKQMKVTRVEPKRDVSEQSTDDILSGIGL